MSLANALSTPLTPPRSIHFEVVDVTPEMAQRLIDNSAINRPLRDGAVKKHARAMVAGRWDLSHQGIAIDTDGRLIDGQHRLHAVVQAGVPVRMLVAMDVPKVAMQHIDTGTARTARDIFMIGGESWITNESIAIARFMEHSGTFPATIGPKERSTDEIRMMVESFRPAIDFALGNLARSPRHIRSAPVMSAIACAWYFEAEKDRLAQFIRLLSDGISSGSVVDEAVIRHRDWIITSGNNSGGRNGRIRVFLRTQRVLQAYMRHESLTKVYTPEKSIYAAPSVFRDNEALHLQYQ